jgi:hypothetical protein
LSLKKGSLKVDAPSYWTLYMWELNSDTNCCFRIKTTITPKKGALGVPLIMSNNANKILSTYNTITNNIIKMLKVKRKGKRDYKLGF